MSYMVMSALLRSNIRADLGRDVLVAIQDHMYEKGLCQFDPRGHWQAGEVNALGALARTLTNYADQTPSTSAVKIEITRLAKIITADHAAVFDVAQSRQIIMMDVAAV